MSRAAARPSAAERRPTVTTIPSFFWRKRWSGLRCGCRSWSPEPFLHNFLCTSQWRICIDVYGSLITLITYPPFCSFARRARRLQDMVAAPGVGYIAESSNIGVTLKHPPPRRWGPLPCTFDFLKIQGRGPSTHAPSTWDDEITGRKSGYSFDTACASRQRLRAFLSSPLSSPSSLRFFRIFSPALENAAIPSASTRAPGPKTVSA